MQEVKYLTVSLLSKIGDRFLHVHFTTEIAPSARRLSSEHSHIWGFGALQIM